MILKYQRFILMTHYLWFKRESLIFGKCLLNFLYQFFTFNKTDQHLHPSLSVIKSLGFNYIPCFGASPPNLVTILLVRLLNIEVNPSPFFADPTP